jgi:hypothetical protein
MVRVIIQWIVANAEVESWPDKLGQLDKWSFCLTTAKMAVEQERR